MTWFLLGFGLIGTAFIIWSTWSFHSQKNQSSDVRMGNLIPLAMGIIILVVDTIIAFIYAVVT